MYNLPQEIEVWYIIPAIRRELAKIFTTKYDFTQERAAQILGVSKAAVCQYLGKKRAKNLKFPAKINKEIEKSAEILSKNNKLALKEILRLLMVIKKTKCCCGICKKFNKGILDLCDMKPIDSGEL
ncbi:MAG: hypothetical protein V1660_03060 [archaeon]